MSTLDKSKRKEEEEHELRFVGILQFPSAPSALTLFNYHQHSSNVDQPQGLSHRQLLPTPVEESVIKTGLTLVMISPYRQPLSSSNDNWHAAST